MGADMRTLILALSTHIRPRADMRTLISALSTHIGPHISPHIVHKNV